MKRPLVMAVLTATVLAAGPLSAGERADALIGQLRADSFQKREAASLALIRLGRAALPALEKASRSTDAETRWRAQAAVRMIRWQVSPALSARIGGALAGYEARPWFRRERLVLDLAAIGEKAAAPTLGRVLAADSCQQVKRAAAIGLLRMGPEGLLAIEKHGGKLLGLPIGSASLRIQIGNGFLEEDKCERALKEYRKAIELEPKNDVAWYNVACALSRMKRVKEAVAALRKAVECGYDDVRWMERDTDLDNLRADEGYRTLVDELERRAPLERRPTENP